MKIDLQTLTLQCKKSREVIDLSSQITFFHGKIGSGKSSIVRIIDFLLGGRLEMTVAIQKELLSASLEINFEKYNALIEREVESNKVRVTWANTKGESTSIIAPIKGNDSGIIWGNDIENLSDLLYFLMGKKPLRVKQSKIKEDTQLIRLSFRDFLVFCYLDQQHLDSSFFKLTEPIVGQKSKDVIEYVIGFYSDKLSQLEIELDECKNNRNSKLGSINQLQYFMDKFGYSNADQLNHDIAIVTEKLNEARIERGELQKGYREGTHSSDRLRSVIRRLISRITDTELAIREIEERIKEQESLKAELTSAKFKMAKSVSFENIFTNVKYDYCPSCGTDIKKREVEADNCHLCHSKIEVTDATEKGTQQEAFRLDLDARIDDLDLSIRKHKRSVRRQEMLLHDLKYQRHENDIKLMSQVKEYESVVLSNFRDVEGRIATYEERLKGLNRISSVPRDIELLEAEIDKIIRDEKDIRLKIKNEQDSLTKALKIVSELEESFLDILIKVGVPGVSKKDRVDINTKTWDVSITGQGTSYNFYNAGSGGKKTLFKVCFGLAFHVVASRNNLPIPQFLMVDTPMKNIGEKVDRAIPIKFYKLIYSLANNELSDHKFIIVDKEYVKPTKGVKVDLKSRYMTPNDSKNPPLISYYKGP